MGGTLELMPTKPVPIERESDELLEALYFIYDILDRAMIPFFLLRTTAEDVISDRELSGDHVDVGICEQHLNKYGMSVIKQLAPTLIKDKNFFLLKHGEVPIRIQVVTSKSRMFLYPDVKFYKAEQFSVPNPFAKYWKIRYLIK